ncbi:MAG TPA: FixH family protein [Casimicrobiaceae bacterium]
MSNRRSSSRADSRSPRPRRGPWPWLLAAGPAAVVVASLAGAWVAVTSNDGVVADDYYKLGLTINRKLAADAPAARDPGATIALAANGEVRVRLQQASVPSHLRLSLRRPGERKSAAALELRHVDGGEWVGAVQDVAPGRRIVTLESELWRLPVSVVDRLPAQIRLGAAASRP